MRRLGLIFNKDDESGIALVTVTDTVTGINIMTEQEVDLYTYGVDATNLAFEEFIFWVDLPYDTSNRYTFDYTHSGRHNPAAVSTTYPISFNGFILTIPNITETKIDRLLTASDSIYSQNYTYPITYTDTIVSIERIVKHSGDDLTEVFDATVGLYAAEFVEYSLDGGITWIPNYVGDYALTWGSNATYDDNIILAGKFSVAFTYAPPTGVDNIQFKVVPVIDAIQCTYYFRQSVDGTGLIDYVNENKLLNYSLELIP